VRRKIVFAVAIVCGCSDGLLDLLPPSDAGAGDGAQSQDAGSNDGSATDVDAAPPCIDGGCACGLSMCSGTCFDLLNDPSHCGDCTKSCSHFQYCRAGNCECLPGFTPCSDGSCHDLLSDPDHCGSCTHPPCNSGEKCESGACGTGACTAPLSGCSFAGNRTACVTLSKGLPYCGDCSTVCGPDQVCAAGHCRPYAPATPCTTCPCADDCARLEGAGSSCCPGIAGGAQPICVHGTDCP
jgi:hypothetical protein